MLGLETLTKLGLDVHVKKFSAISGLEFRIWPGLESLKKFVPQLIGLFQRCSARNEACREGKGIIVSRLGRVAIGYQGLSKIAFSPLPEFVQFADTYPGVRHSQVRGLLKHAKCFRMIGRLVLVAPA